MNTYAIVAFLATLAAANAGLLAAPSANIIQGPSSRTTIVGPEGSVISAVAPGEAIVSEQIPGLAAYTVPVVAAPAAYAAAPVAYSAPLAYAAHAAYAAPVVAAHGSVNTIVAGPSRWYQYYRRPLAGD